MGSTLVVSKPAIIDSASYTEVNFAGTTDGSYWLVVRASGYFPLGSTSKVSISESQKPVYDFTNSSSNSAGETESVIMIGSKYYSRFGDLDYNRIIGTGDIDLFKSANGVKINQYVPINK